MRIKTILQLNAIISIAIIILIGVVIFWTEHEENLEREEEILADSIVEGMIQLRALTYEYSLYHEDRVEDQWQLRYDSQAKLLGKIKLRTPHDQAILLRMRQNLAGMDTLFLELIEAHEKQESVQENIGLVQELEQMLAARLLLKSQMIVSDAFELAESSNAEQEAVHRKGILLVLFLTVILSTFYIAVSIFTIKSIVKPIAKLQQSTEIVGCGNLDHRVDIRSYDEINQLSGAFNQMTSKLKERTNEFGLAKDEAVRANNVKTELLMKMSHELRTPLNAVMGFSELLKMKEFGELNEKQKHYVDNIYNSGKHLLGIISDMLDLVKVESGEKLPLLIESFLAPEAIGETLIFVSEKAAQKNITLKKEIDPELDMIYADKLRFKQILLNLIDNAIKFSKPGGGTVTITAGKAGDMASFSVSDKGIGIREEEIGRLFDQFHQVDSGIDRKYGGAGIGLAIVKQLVEQHGGQIWVKSRYGEGTTFTFTIPVEVKKGE